LLAYIALVPSAFGFLLYARGLVGVQASAAALLTLAEPVVAAVLAVIVLGEPLPLLGWFGIAAVITGLVLAPAAPS